MPDSTETTRIRDEIARGHKDLGDIRQDLQRIFEKIDSLKEEMLLSKKDIEFLKEMFHDKIEDIKTDFNNKIAEIKKDVDAIGQLHRKHKQEIKEYICEQVKRGNVMTKLWVSVSAMMGMSAIIMFLLNKFWR